MYTLRCGFLAVVSSDLRFPLCHSHILAPRGILLITDTVDIQSGVKIERHYFTLIGTGVLAYLAHAFYNSAFRR